MSEYVFCLPNQSHLYDTAIEVNGEWRSLFERKTLEDLQIKHPEMQLLTWSDAMKQIEKNAEKEYIKAPQEITKDEWWEALECLPPLNHHGDGINETFMISEATWGNIRAIYCQYRDRYFALTDRDTLTHREIVEKCAIACVPF